MSVTQLNPPLGLETPKGPALAHFLIDYGMEHHLQWVCFLDSNGECWTFQNPEVRIQRNLTYGRNEVPLPKSWNGNGRTWSSSGDASKVNGHDPTRTDRVAPRFAESRPSGEHPRTNGYSSVQSPPTS